MAVKLRRHRQSHRFHEMKLLGKEHGRKGGDVVINVTAMVDMMMVLVIFLVMNFNASGEMLFLSKDIKMPGAENGDSVTRVPIVSISNKNQLYFEGVILTDLNNIDPNDPNWRIAELEEKLVEQRNRERLADDSLLASLVGKVAPEPDTDVGPKNIPWKKLAVVAGVLGVAGIVYVKVLLPRSRKVAA
jgi:biopolymer transport protein ExbD